MGTAYTPGRLPYPDGNDLVSNGDNQIGALANTLDPVWANPTFGSGWVALSLYPAKYRIIGNQWLVFSGSAYYNGGVPVLSTVCTVPRGVTVDDSYPYVAGGIASATSRGSTFAAATAYLDLRAAGQLVCHLLATVASVDCLHLDNVAFRIKAS